VSVYFDIISFGCSDVSEGDSCSIQLQLCEYPSTGSCTPVSLSYLSATGLAQVMIILKIEEGEAEFKTSLDRYLPVELGANH